MSVRKYDMNTRKTNTWKDELDKDVHLVVELTGILNKVSKTNLEIMLEEIGRIVTIDNMSLFSDVLIKKALFDEHYLDVYARIVAAVSNEFVMTISRKLSADVEVMKSAPFLGELYNVGLLSDCEIANIVMGLIDRSCGDKSPLDHLRSLRKLISSIRISFKQRCPTIVEEIRDKLSSLADMTTVARARFAFMDIIDELK